MKINFNPILFILHLMKSNARITGSPIRSTPVNSKTYLLTRKKDFFLVSFFYGVNSPSTTPVVSLSFSVSISLHQSPIRFQANSG